MWITEDETATVCPVLIFWILAKAPFETVLLAFQPLRKSALRYQHADRQQACRAHGPLRDAVPTVYDSEDLARGARTASAGAHCSDSAYRGTMADVRALDRKAQVGILAPLTREIVLSVDPSLCGQALRHTS
jgi:hypothetical protein